jgi:hypothetical protein
MMLKLTLQCGKLKIALTVPFTTVVSLLLLLT